MLGDGKIQFPAVMQAIRDIGFTGYANLEMDGGTPAEPRVYSEPTLYKKILSCPITGPRTLITSFSVTRVFLTMPSASSRLPAPSSTLIHGTQGSQDGAGGGSPAGIERCRHGPRFGELTEHELRDLETNRNRRRGPVTSSHFSETPHGAGGRRELILFDAEALEHGNEEVRERVVAFAVEGEVLAVAGNSPPAKSTGRLSVTCVSALPRLLP